jgi:DNA polymerase-3 subunit beta
MKFTAEKNTILDSLQIVQSIVGMRHTIPVLGNVLISASNNKISFTTTDIDVSIRSSFTANVVEEGATTLPVKRFLNIIKELPADEINIDSNEDNVSEVVCNSSKFKIIGLPESDFPEFPKLDGEFSFVIEQGLFKDMLKKIAYSTSTDETRRTLSGVFMQFKDEKLTMVATDCRRLSLIEQEMEFPKEAENDVIIPNKTVNYLLHILQNEDSELKIYVKNNMIMFEVDNVIMVSKLIDGVYPNYKQVIPTQCEKRVQISREDLLAAIRRVSLVINSETISVKLQFENNSLQLSITSPEIGEAQENIPIKYNDNKTVIGFNPIFMMDALKNLTSDDIYLEFTDNLSAGVIKCDIPFLCVIMPMRLD